MWADYFRLAFKTFLTQKKRTFLTLLGIFIGIAAVVSLISLGQGLKSGIDKQFEILGTNKIFVMPGTGGGFNFAQTAKLTSDDMDVIRSTSGVEEASGMIYKMASVEFGGERKYTFVIGIDDSDSSFDAVLESFGVLIDDGRGVESVKEANIGYRFGIGDFFDSAVESGDKMVIEGKKFKAAGTVTQVGNPQDDSNIYITLDAANDLFGTSKDEMDQIMVTVKDGEDTPTVSDRIKRRMRNIRNVDEGDEDFTVQTTEDFAETFGIVLTIVQIILIGISAISLLVGGVNIANTMYTAVMERTREIGVMKAIGARNSDVFMIFLIESGILGVAGGIIGIIIGIGLSKMVSFAAIATGYTFIETSFPWYLTFGALLFSFVVGAMAGTLPAIQASKLKPVDALRYE
ncbi:MAG: ABC transporter permease [Candidatus Woesearchaeota archaeon]